MRVKITKPKHLKGTINIGGSKNTVLPLIACAILTKEEITLKNVPCISDVMNMLKIATNIKGIINYNPDTKELKLKFPKIKYNINCEETKKIRASYYFIGPILSRKNKTITNYPGGCNFSDRPIDYHLNALQKIGYKIKLKNNKIYITKQIRNNKIIDIKFPKPSVGATINAILTSVCSNKIINIYNYANEPEVLSVIEMLNLMGGNIILTPVNIKIIGVKKLHGITYDIPFDRIEAGSYMILASSIPNSKVELENVDHTKMSKVIEVLENMNVKITIKSKKIIIESPNELKPINLTIGTYPDFPTDLQQIILMLLLKAKGTSTLIDTIYPKRQSQIKLLQDNNINIFTNNNQIIINESKEIKITYSEAYDLRGGFSLIVLAMYTEGLIIDNFEIIKRGYEDVINKLKKLEIMIEKE